MFGVDEHLGHLTVVGHDREPRGALGRARAAPGRARSSRARTRTTRTSACARCSARATRRSPQDARGRLDLDALEARLRAGGVGTVVATLGHDRRSARSTTSRRSPTCAREHGARLHVDAAYGGFFALLADGGEPGVDAARRSRRSRAPTRSSSTRTSTASSPTAAAASCSPIPASAASTRTTRRTRTSPRDDLHLGEISLECSRAGAAAAALWTTLRALPLTRDGLGRHLAAARAAALALAGALERTSARARGRARARHRLRAARDASAAAISAAAERAFDTLAAGRLARREAAPRHRLAAAPPPVDRGRRADRHRAAPLPAQAGARRRRARARAGARRPPRRRAGPRMKRPFRQVDVFTDDAVRRQPRRRRARRRRALDDEEMQRFAHWTNLSETTFVLPPTDAGADYRVRIFTPVAELPFAGHPTLGTCHAWLEAGGAPATPTRRPGVRRRPDRASAATDAGLAFAAPPLLATGPVEDALVERLAAIARHRPRRDRRRRVGRQRAGLGRRAARQRRRGARARAGVRRPRRRRRRAAPAGRRVAFEVRAFFPKDGAMVEDPVTGSLNASLAHVAARTRPRDGAVRRPPGHRARPRRPRPRRREDADGTIWVGGGTITCVAGEVEL